MERPNALNEEQLEGNAPKRRKLDHLVKASQACTFLKSIARALLDEREKAANAEPTSPKSSNSSQKEVVLSPSLLTQSATYFSMLKRWNRLAYEGGVLAKSNTDEEREVVDRVRLELQNLRYEASHLAREIDKCESFQSVYQDVVLVPEEEFLLKAPKELLGADNPHTHMINQLKYEMQERVRLEQEKGNQLSLSMKLTKENREKKAEIENIERELETLFQSVVAMQTKLHMQPTSTPASSANKSTQPTPPLPTSSSGTVEDRNGSSTTERAYNPSNDSATKTPTSSANLAASASIIAKNSDPIIENKSSST